MSNDVQVFIEKQRTQFEAALPEGAGVKFEQEAGFAVQALQGNNFLYQVASRNPDDLKNAIVNVAAIGVSLNPAKKHAYLIPRDGRVTLDVSYMGMNALATESGAVLWVQCELVYEKDEFWLHGMGMQPTHNRNPFASNRGEPVGAYCVAKLPTGDYLTTAMSMDEIYVARDHSQSWKSHVKKGRQTPWVTHPAEMAKKTVLKRAFKMWPASSASSRLEAAIHYQNTVAGEGFDTINEEKDITPEGQDQDLVNQLVERLQVLSRSPEKMLEYASKRFERNISSIEHLTNEEVREILSLMEVANDHS